MKILNRQKNKTANTNKGKTKKYRKKNKSSKKYRKQNKSFKKYSGGFIDPPPAIQPEFSVKNPTVSAEDSGSPYQRVNNQLQSNNKNQANLNKTLNGQAPKTSGGKRKNTKDKKYT